MTLFPISKHPLPRRIALWILIFIFFTWPLLLFNRGIKHRQMEVFPAVKPSKEIIEFIKRKEGFMHKAYKPLKDDRWTIGYGFTRIRGRPVKITDVITKEEADVELERLLTEEYAKKLTPKFPVPQREFDALISLAYNVGVFRLLNSVTWKLYQQGEDISHRFLMWAKFDGKVIPGLVNRRKEELKIYKEGRYV